jgi:hypothetical protein
MVESNTNNTKANKSLVKNKKLEEEVLTLRLQLETERKRATLLENQLFAMRSAQGGQHLLQGNFPHVSGPVQMGGHVSGGHVSGPGLGGGQTHMSHQMGGQQHHWGADTAALALSALSQNQQAPQSQQAHQPHPHKPHPHPQHQQHHPQQQHPHMHNMHNVFSVRDTY